MSIALPYHPVALRCRAPRTPPHPPPQAAADRGIGLRADSVGSPRPLAPSLTFRSPAAPGRATPPGRGKENHRATRHADASHPPSSRPRRHIPCAREQPVSSCPARSPHCAITS
ncbi:hypothetical protein PVAP13_5KG658207 [Panicum virgatum]|uniref:Uncharacterized protein n=1 Tax=Panicum virgatum TaxID=38727 RepID=A0A8T0SRK6_PANVG|nr:hypothetical protein PVAP13_5KG658207 [Panicum virgatum]